MGSLRLAEQPDWLRSVEGPLNDCPMSPRVVYMPDVKHQGANIDRSLMKAAGLGTVDEKMLFLRRFRHGPFNKSADGGARHWQHQMATAWEVLQRASPQLL